MLMAMKRLPAHLRLLVALGATLAMLLAVPLHAAHTHGDDHGHMHAPCAACQIHAPTAAPIQTITPFVAPPADGTLPAPANETIPHTARPAPTGCRAPPASLAQ